MASRDHPTSAPAPPTNLEAEESVLGALMLAEKPERLFAQFAEGGFHPSHFYRDSHATIYRASQTLDQRGEPVDAITVADQLEEQGDLERVGGKGRIHELAGLVTAVANAHHYARLVTEAARHRDLIRVGNEIQRLGYDRPGETQALIGRAAALVDQLTSATRGQLQPLWLHEAIHEQIPDTLEYVEGVLEAGVLADIVGLPYLHKSAIALELAVKVAKGRGLFLGKYPIRQQAKVAYFWADDSRPQELKRIQAYAKANELGPIPVAFYLNPGLSLPDDIPAIKAQIREHGHRLCIFDSLYNFGPIGLDWSKDSGPVLAIYAALKRLCDEIEGLTILLVDHAAKPSDSNKGRDDSISSFGSIWKAAAVRASIVVTKTGSTLFVSATGNNVKGFPRTPAFFNDDRLELTILEQTGPDPEHEADLDAAVLDYITRNPGKSTNQIRKSVTGRDSAIDAALTRLADHNAVIDTFGTSAQLLGPNPAEVSGTDPESSAQNGGPRKPKTAWIPLNHAEKPRPDNAGPTPAEPQPATGSFVVPEPRPKPPPPKGERWAEPEREPTEANGTNPTDVEGDHDPWLS